MLRIDNIAGFHYNLCFEKEYNYIVGLDWQMEWCVTGSITSWCKRHNLAFIGFEQYDKPDGIIELLRKYKNDDVIIFSSSDIVLTDEILYALKDTKGIKIIMIKDLNNINIDSAAVYSIERTSYGIVQNFRLN